MRKSQIIKSPPIQAQTLKSPTARTAASPPALTAHLPSTRTAFSPPPLTAKRAQTARTIVVMRHGERLDDLFGKWFDYCKNKHGHYRQRDLNQPPDLSPLNRPLPEYENDTALTVLGHVLAQKIGRAMLVSGRSPDMVYCSPALRCIQTASVAATMTGKPFKLRIDPGLFENFDLYERKTPQFVTIEELKNSGFNIDDDYTPFCKLEDLFAFPETSEMYNDRVQSTLQYIANKSAPGRGTVLVAAHASTVDLAFGKFHPRFLKAPRLTTPENLVNISLPIPYSSNVTFMRNSDDEQWQYIREALPPITYRNFSNRLNHDFIERNQTAQQQQQQQQ
uniref:Uncharacterized protein n=1 Tax=Panagrolaimus davidi TaxID=227884 RepID=A0A914PM04_9BILA